MTRTIEQQENEMIEILKKLSELIESNRILRLHYEQMIHAYHSVAGTFRKDVQDSAKHDVGSFRTCTNHVCKQALRVLVDSEV